MLIRRGDIPFEDIQILEAFYEKIPHPMFNVEPHFFIWEIRQQFKNDSFTDYIDRETHYEIERRGYKWGEESRLFIGLEHHEYMAIRAGILERFAEIFIGSLSTGKFDFEPCSLHQNSLKKIAA